MSVENAEVLERALSILEQTEWCQGTEMRDEDGNDIEDPDRACSLCVGAALMLAEKPDYREINYLNSLGYGAMARFLGTDRLGVTHWNDAPDRTQAEVVTALRSAAARERGEE